jgi:MarR family transcriptional regulator, organic hydroperoxide resistance regulator
MMPTDDHPPYTLEDSLGYLVNRVSRTIRQYLNQELKRRNFQVTGEQFAVLVHLWRQEGQTQQELGQELTKEKTTMTRMLDGLEAQDLIRRRSDPRDGRIRRIHLTSKSQKTMKKLTALAGEVLKTSQKEVTPSELQTCKKVLRRVHQTLTLKLDAHATLK